MTSLAANATYEYGGRASPDSDWTTLSTFRTAAATALGAKTDGSNATTIFMPLMRR